MTTKKSKKRTTKPKPQDPAAGTETLELSVAQVYEQLLRRVVNEWAKKVLGMLAEDTLALERPDGVREIEPQTSDAALLRTLCTFGAGAVKGWVQLPSRPPPAEMPRQKPNRESVERAEQRHRIEQAYVYKVDMRRVVNEDRARAGLPPLPPSEDEPPTARPPGHTS